LYAPPVQLSTHVMTLNFPYPALVVGVEYIGATEGAIFFFFFGRATHSFLYFMSPENIPGYAGWDPVTERYRFEPDTNVTRKYTKMSDYGDDDIDDAALVAYMEGYDSPKKSREVVSPVTPTKSKKVVRGGMKKWDDSPSGKRVSRGVKKTVSPVRTPMKKMKWYEYPSHITNREVIREHVLKDLGEDWFFVPKEYRSKFDKLAWVDMEEEPSARIEWLNPKFSLAIGGVDDEPLCGNGCSGQHSKSDCPVGHVDSDEEELDRTWHQVIDDRVEKATLDVERERKRKSDAAAEAALGRALLDQRNEDRGNWSGVCEGCGVQDNPYGDGTCNCDD
jgi:hypothetical protein